jgi:predicted MPP superfamily phosphohydrolase
VGIYATHVEPRWLRTDRATLDVAVVDGDPIRVGVIADLQTTRITDHERRAIDRLMAEEPDLILLAGDYLQSDGPEFRAELPEARDLLAELSAPGGVFLVQGDVDSPERMELLTEGLDVEWLDHEVVSTEVGGRRIHLGGIPPSFASAESRATIASLAEHSSEDLRILVSHRPDAVYEVPEGGADLVVAGHTHGGQVALPFIGPPITLSNVPRDVAAGGLHEVDGVPIYLSVGVGLERHNAPQVRFGVRPSIGVLTLT